MPGKSHEDEVVREAIRSARETGDPFARNWALHLSLNARSGEPAAALAEIRSQLGEIQAGFGFLKRTAARIAAANGAWPLVHQIASAELKRRCESRSWAGL
ncbi:hypothetical protein [Oceanicella actignis]|uniref:Uncharacterized protein n=1 Tax=Oceanicella actignis TaxID=1189325 RepID=A0A1M7U381_9RHOB|nr:hypothetical protein [Oceanicella actignis]SET86346.1 hypothetical protein SAMN04488119_11310 [Oceanicella actignis]SHN77347.1 hypothetical protein SAMN05216200_11522 [Oceanicella actignis]